MHADKARFLAPATLAKEPTIPAEPDTRLDRDAHGACGQHALAIGLVRFLENLPAGHGDNARADPLRFQQVARFHGDGDFRSGRHQDRLPLASHRIGQHIAALGDHVLGRVGLAQSGQVLAAECQDRWRGLLRQRHFPRLGGFDRIGGADHQRIGRGAQHGQMLDRLVGRPILAQTDAVMGHDIGDGQPHQGRQPHRGAGIIGKHHEGAAIGAHAAMQRHAVHRRRHSMLADAIVDMAALTILGAEGADILGIGVVRPGEVGRAAQMFAQERVDHLERQLAGGAGGDLGKLVGMALLQGADRGAEFLGDVAAKGAGKLGLFAVREGGELTFP